VLVGALLHTADLCNPCLRIEQCKEWEKRISHEFLFQSTLEAEVRAWHSPTMCSDAKVANRNVRDFGGEMSSRGFSTRQRVRDLGYRGHCDFALGYRGTLPAQLNFGTWEGSSSRLRACIFL
jgi:hypothetical protein